MTSLEFDSRVPEKKRSKSGSPNPSRRKAELRILMAHFFFICAWIFTRFGGIYSGMSRGMPKTFNFTKLSKCWLNRR